MSFVIQIMMCYFNVLEDVDVIVSLGDTFSRVGSWSISSGLFGNARLPYRCKSMSIAERRLRHR